MLRITVILLWVIVAYKWGDWRHWQRYYPTLLFVIAGDLIYEFIAYNYPLWALVSPNGKATLATLTLILISLPAGILVFLSNYPEGKRWLIRVFYIIIWVCVMVLLEYIMVRAGFFRYSHGWNIWWSAAFNLVMYPLLRIHFKNPPAAWILAAILGLSVVVYFHIPIASMK